MKPNMNNAVTSKDNTFHDMNQKVTIATNFMKDSINFIYTWIIEEKNKGLKKHKKNDKIIFN